ncbi:tRNA (guanosine(18)-2'-O)-methyltransferase [Patiriisocius marinistellae]|uniref:tRNA (guanosine(18)-2'-O)-methyltransferase n=1 Tax=Patiriisocius marinistellae TaxID=2494560 RepID=A0A5J4G119_9FLAO|nr:RNA methyltransferase [Patiriisocius marinistellae]GEQ86055.1 tRNA (guanosine(18)-2'-O)-methyltransferase [Patiriisocius marinistellae]
MDLGLLEHLQSYLTERRIERFESILKQRTRHFHVVTEDVYQLHNTSAVMRSCDVFGVQDLSIVEEINSKQIDKEIAMGSQKWVNLNRYNSISTCIEDLKTEGYQIVATSPHGKSVELHDFDVTKKSAFFFGKEKEGLSDVVLNNADVSLKIPMYGFTESLNISVSAAIVLQHVVTRLRKSDVDWQISEDEKNELRIEWAKNTIKSSAEIVERFYEDK